MEASASASAEPDTADAGAGEDSAIRPFTIDVPEEELTDLRSRINATKWPDRETVSDASQGVQLATMQALASYWGTDYDWRKFEERFQALPHVITEIDGVDIHFIHVRSEHEDALPLIVTHGWPGSTIEQLKIIDPLTNPTEHGASASDAFHLVIPSMPGHGFSGKPKETGWDPIRIAKAWVVLMKRLGYTRFVAQGGDWGNAVSEQMALLKPEGLLGIHTNMPATVPPGVSKALATGGPEPSGLSADEKKAYEVLDHFYATGTGYAGEMGNRPQTLYGVADSPVGLAAWMIDHDERSYALIARAFDGDAGGLSRDDVLDNISHYWLTNTGVSAGRLYWESKLAFFDVKGVEIPVGVSVFPDELYPAPQSWAEKAYPKLIHFNNKLDEGGHFAAWEQPQAFSEEVRTTFRSLR
jgi:pimeloyl-ACP methyl ester carboxylesterase